MKKLGSTFIKFITFFGAWIVIIPLLGDYIDVENKAVSRLLAEFVPLVIIIILTQIFTKLIEKGTVRVSFSKEPKKDVMLAVPLGITWIVAILIMLLITQVLKFKFDSFVPSLFVYIVALVLNTVMQEYLVRGYLFSMLDKNYNQVVALIVTTLLFVVLHGGAFEAGMIAVLNVFTMSFFVTALMIYTEGILAPIMVHFIWNFIGGILTNSISLPYPHLFTVQTQGNILFSGGQYGVEASIVTLIVNSLLTIYFTILIMQKKSC